MKKNLIILSLLILVTPQVALASWWNPTSWKIFRRAETKTQVLENRVKELEQKLANSTTTATTTSSAPKTTKSPEVTRKPTPTPNNNSTEVKEIIAVIDSASLELAMNMAESAELMQKMTDDYIAYTPYLDATGQRLFENYIMSVTTDLNSLVSEMKGYSEGLQSTRQQILSSGRVDKQYWSATGLADIVNHQKAYKSKLVSSYSTYNDVLVALKNRISKQNSYNQQAVKQQQQYIQQVNEQTRVCNEYINKVNNVDSEVRAEITASGGTATQSQVQALVNGRIRSIPVPSGC